MRPILDLHSIGRAIAALDGREAASDFATVAEEIQRTLLDIRLPRETGFSTGLHAAPGRLAGGDYVDAVPAHGSPTVFGIGDVSGKSLPSALKALSLKFALRGVLAAGADDLGRVLELANRIVLGVVGEDEYLSVLLWRVPPSLDRLEYANAGHDPPIVYRARSGLVEELPPAGIVLGVDSSATYRMDEFPLAHGDVAVFYTDGFTEARNAAGEQFTLSQVKAGLRALYHLEPQALADALFERIEVFTAGTFRDDASILTLRVSD